MKKLLKYCLLCIITSIQAQTLYKLENIGYITIPNEMELQSGIYKKIAQKHIKTHNFEVSENRIVFQQKGLNKLNNTSFQSYARVIIENQYGDFEQNTNLSSQELKEVNSIIKKNVEYSLKQMSSDMKIINWYGTTTSRIGGKSAVKLSYTRRLGNNSPVYVVSYIVPNSNQQYTITLSYRADEKAKWQPIYNKILNSLTFK